MAELVSPVALCTPQGRLNPAAVGWSREPLHTANLRGWGRTKRWEYWALVTPRFIVGMTISSLDYLGAHTIYVLDRRSGSERTMAATEPLARSVRLPDRAGVGVARAHARGIALEFAVTAAGARLRAEGPGLRIVADVGSPPGHEALAVVVPWSSTRFHYTLKDLGRPVTGAIAIDGQEHAFGADGSFAVRDHGRGRWPYATAWTWAVGFGRVAGRRTGLQLGGLWTDGTGSTENGLFVDGRLHKVGADLTWEHDDADWMAPWRIAGPRVGVTFAPFHVRAAATNLGVVSSEVHQCFGRFTGWVVDDGARRLRVDGLVGWAEEARHRW